MEKDTFPEDFIWGTATAAFQVEGAAREDGRGDSIWDVFCRTPGKVYGGDNGDVACDQYHRYVEDIALLTKLGVSSYRFSLAWPRLIPDGRGAINPAAVDHYRRLIAALTAAGIEPVVTLYHWDLPQCLETKGGWAARDTAFAFADYARACFKEFGSAVRRWITINEPHCVAFLGYLTGVHAPGLTDSVAAYRAVHHLNLAHGLAVEAFRAGGYPGEIGIDWNLVMPRAATRRPEDRRAVDNYIRAETRVFTDPVFGRGYPVELIRDRGIDFPVLDGDLAHIAAPLDFIGLNYYTERPMSGAAADPDFMKTEPSWEATSDVDWPLTPDGLLRQLRWMRDESGGLPLYVMENGCACADRPVVESDGRKRIHDRWRVDYLRAHFDVCRQALAEGLPLKGYFLWSLIDNFEWAHGYSKRFGIVFCDYKTLERIPKDSFYYFRDVIAGYR